MKCPFCSQELQCGVIQSTHPMFWLESPARFPVKPVHKKGCKRLPSLGDGIRDFPYIKAYRCLSCGCILVKDEESVL